MVLPLVEIIEGDKKSPVVIQIDGIKFYSIKKVAEITQASRQTIWRHCKDGTIPSFRANFYSKDIYIPESVAKRLCQLVPYTPES